MTDPRVGRRRLYLMRHGHVDYFDPDLTDFRQVHLTPEGRDQAKAAGQALRDVPFDIVFNSGLPRTIETSELVVDHHASFSAKPISVPLFEEIKSGHVVVETREALAAILAFSFDSATEEGASFLPEGELFIDALDRTVKGLNDIVTNHEWKQALLVAHDGINRLLLGHACGAGLAGIGHFEQDLGCINVLDLDVVAEPDGSLSFARILIKSVNITAYDTVKKQLPRTSLEHLFDIDFGGARPSK